MNMLKSILGKIWRLLRKSDRREYNYILSRLIESSIERSVFFDDKSYKDSVLNFLKRICISKERTPNYVYSLQQKETNLYSNVYALLTRSLCNDLDLKTDEREQIVKYLDSFQSSEDGLFYDPLLSNEFYNDSDWWGARHLAVHVTSLYTILGARPKYEFKFLDYYKDLAQLEEWLKNANWNGRFSHTNDIDNKIMNVASLLQYQRDFWGDEQASKAVKFLQNFLLSKINPKTGMWGDFDEHNRHEISRMVQFAYHLFPMFFYDGIELNYKEKIISNVLKTQNRLGGFSPDFNSSACEDIDSIDILIRLSSQTDFMAKEVNRALRRSFTWVLANQNDDGGFVFRRNRAFIYGHSLLSSGVNESSVFATWFRTLSIGYLANHFQSGSFKITRSPGYEF